MLAYIICKHKQKHRCQPSPFRQDSTAFGVFVPLSRFTLDLSRFVRRRTYIAFVPRSRTHAVRMVPVCSPIIAHRRRTAEPEIDNSRILARRIMATRDNFDHPGPSKRPRRDWRNGKAMGCCCLARRAPGSVVASIVIQILIFPMEGYMM